MTLNFPLSEFYLPSIAYKITRFRKVYSGLAYITHCKAYLNEIPVLHVQVLRISRELDCGKVILLCRRQHSLPHARVRPICKGDTISSPPVHFVKVRLGCLVFGQIQMTISVLRYFLWLGVGID